MYKKRGQLSTFVVVGIVLLIVSALWLFSQAESVQRPEGQEVPLQTEIVENYVQDCVQEVTTPGVYLIAYQGGRYYQDNEYAQEGFEDANLVTFERALPYYLINSEKTGLNKAKLEVELAQYVNDNLPLCTDFSAFFKEGIVITEGVPKTKATLAKDRVLFEITYPLDLSIEENTYAIEKFRYEVPLRLEALHAIAEKIASIIQEDPSTAHFPELLALNNKHTVMISVVPFDDEATAYSIYDDKEEFWIDGKPLIFWFAIKNSAGKENVKANTAPSIVNNKDFVLRKDVPFMYTLKATDAEGDLVTFRPSNNQIPLQASGLLNFTPTKTGTFGITITATDSRGLATEVQSRFIIED